MKTTILLLSVFGISLTAAEWGQGGGSQGWQGGRQDSQGAYGQGTSRSLYGGGQGPSGNQRGQGFGQQGMYSSGQGRSLQGDTRYGANIIDTPEMYGYEATIPGATSRFVSYRSAQRGSRARGQGYDGQFSGGRDQQFSGARGQQPSGGDQYGTRSQGGSGQYGTRSQGGSGQYGPSPQNQGWN